MWLTFTLGYAFKNVGPDFHYRPPVFYLSQSVIKLRKNGEYCVSHDLIISCITITFSLYAFRSRWSEIECSLHSTETDDNTVTVVKVRGGRLSPSC